MVYTGRTTAAVHIPEDEHLEEAGRPAPNISKEGYSGKEYIAGTADLGYNADTENPKKSEMRTRNGIERTERHTEKDTRVVIGRDGKGFRGGRI